MKAKTAHRILVTGSRGKSSIVRLLHTAMNAAGLPTYARITGVIPRELGPHTTRTIARSSGAHVEEMRWWLGQLPASAQGIVLENSAITPELQDLAGRWLQPDISIISNTYADHQEVWGPGDAHAAQVLVAGITSGQRVVVPEDAKSDQRLIELLEKRDASIIFAKPIPEAGADHRASNTGLAIATIQNLGVEKGLTLQAMLALPPDSYDFHVARHGGAELAMAFSVNDITCTQAVFGSLGWPEADTRLVYNHRNDRPERLRSFVNWLRDSPWRQVLIIGDKPRLKLDFARYMNIKNTESLLKLFQPGDRVFGCGNISGLPLALAIESQP
jgi:hypothetical protein